jgi:hypothetical protein
VAKVITLVVISLTMKVAVRLPPWKNWLGRARPLDAGGVDFGLFESVTLAPAPFLMERIAPSLHRTYIQPEGI